MTTEVDVDAFPAAEEDDGAVRRLEDAAGASSGDSLAFARLELMATLQDGGFTARSNGTKYGLTFETDVEGFVRLAVETAKGPGGYDVTWNQVHLGTGVLLDNGSWRRDADGAAHYKVKLLMSESELGSIGRTAKLGGKHGKMVLEPMQGTLGLGDGTAVDLTAKA